MQPGTFHSGCSQSKSIFDPQGAPAGRCPFKGALAVGAFSHPQLSQYLADGGVDDQVRPPVRVRGAEIHQGQPVSPVIPQEPGGGVQVPPTMSTSAWLMASTARSLPTRSSSASFR